MWREPGRYMPNLCPRNNHMKPYLAFLLGLAALPAASASITFNVDAAGQVDGKRVFRHVPHVAAIGYENQPNGWMVQRYADTIWQNAGWYGLSNINAGKDEKYPLWKKSTDGSIVFEPSPVIEREIADYALNAGVKPLVVMGTPTIPPPLVEGGKPEAGYYGFNVRQPNDYAKWGIYLDSLFQWLAGRYGQEEVRSWGFVFGIESDWQAKAVYPGTEQPMSRDDNRKEFLKMVDHFQAALERNLGPGVYLGIYGAFEHQSEPFIKHWATRKSGTPMAFTGFSDWTLMDFVNDLNPLSREGEAQRASQADSFSEMASIAAGMAWKHDHIDSWASAHPALRGLETNLPEAGYFDTKGGTAPDGSVVPADYLPADHQGAALYGLRLIGYSHAPRIAWAWNRYGLGTGDIIYNLKDTAKAPVFHAQRISRALHGRRLIPVVKSGETPSGTVIEAMALAPGSWNYEWNVLLASYNRNPSAGGSHDVILTLTGLTGIDKVRVGVSTVDEKRNNWWPEWTKYRDDHAIPYVAGPNRGHLGGNVLYKPEYLRNTNDILGTMRPEDHAKWLRLSNRYAGCELAETSAMENLAVVDGTVSIKLPTPASSLSLIRVTPVGTMENMLPMALRTLSLPLGGKGASETIKLAGLQPDTGYTLAAEVRSSMRVADYGITLQRPDGGGRVVGYGDYSGRSNMIILTARTDTSGTLEVIPFTTAQQAAPGDRVSYRFVSMIPTVPGPRITPGNDSTANAETETP